MTLDLIRQIIREHLDESSASRRAATRAAIAQDPSIPTTKTGRVDTLQQLAQFAYDLAEQTKSGPPKYAFTMTSIQKVGINPASGYNTPIAIYAYPATPEYVNKLLGGTHMKIGLDKGLDDPNVEGGLSPYAETDDELPFVADAPFINFFELTDPSTTYYTSVGMDEGQYRAAIDALLGWYQSNGQDPEAGLTFRRALVKAQRHNKVMGLDQRPGAASVLTPYQRLATIWSLSRALSKVRAFKTYTAGQERIAAGERPEPDQSDVSLWRSLLIVAGVKVVVDDAGAKLIHPQEPVQLAVMDPSVITPLRQFDNVTPAGRPGRGKTRQYPDLVDQQMEFLTGKVQKYLEDGLKGQGTARSSALSAIGALLAGTYNAHTDNNFKRILRKQGLLSKLSELVTTSPWMKTLGDRYPAYYDFTGDVGVIDTVVNSYVTGEKIDLDGLQSHIYDALGAAGNVDTRNDYVIKLIERFARIVAASGFFAFDAGSFKSFMSNLCRDQDFVIAFGGNSSHLIQLMKPIFDIANDEFMREEIIDLIRTTFAQEERLEAEQRRETQTRALQKKFSQRPEVDDVLADAAPFGIAQFKKRVDYMFRDIHDRLQSERQYLRSPGAGDDNGGFVYPINIQDLLPGSLFLNRILGVPQEVTDKMTQAYKDCATDMQKITSGQLTATLGAVTRLDPEDDAAARAEIIKIALDAVDKLEAIAAETKKEILGLLAPYDTTEQFSTAPVYERVLRRLKSRSA